MILFLVNVVVIVDIFVVVAVVFVVLIVIGVIVINVIVTFQESLLRDLACLPVSVDTR